MEEGSVKAMRKHALIVGPRRVGKSTLIRKVIETLNYSVAGFETKKESTFEVITYQCKIEFVDCF